MERVGQGPWEAKYPTSPVPQVHTDVSPGYDKPTPREPVVLPEGTAPTPTQRQGRRSKAESMARTTKRGRGKLSYGEGRRSIIDLITTHASEGHEFNAVAVFGWMTSETRNQWINAYKTKKSALTRLRSVLGDIHARTDFPLSRVEGVTSTFIYTGGWTVGRQPTNYTPTTKQSKTARATRLAKAAGTPVTSGKVVTTLENYANIGFNLNEEPLFQHKDTGAIGTLVFDAIGR